MLDIFLAVRLFIRLELFTRLELSHGHHHVAEHEINSTAFWQIAHVHAWTS